MSRGLAQSVGLWSAVVALTVSGCAPLPATGPRLATDAGPGAQPRTDGEEELSAPPDWLVPESDLDWVPCTDGGVDGVPDEIGIDCALPGQTPVLRISTPRTPEDAPPLVVVAGPDSSPDELVVRLSSDATELADAHPLVIVDHRGRTGPAGTCLTFGARRTLDRIADLGVDPGSPETRSDLADTAQSCTDQLPGRELRFGSAAAAEDLEALRQAWNVPGLAVLGMGSGARTALAFAGAHPGRVSSLVLDSPAPTGGDQETAVRAALDGSNTALRLWASSCTLPECGPGDATEKVEAITRAIDDARSPDSVIPAALLTDVVRSALGDLSGASADAASTGDTILGDLAGAAAGELPDSVRHRAERLSSSSLPYVAECSDLATRVPVNRVEELADEWDEESPFGQILAAQLSACSTWPVPTIPELELSGPAPVLLLSGIADPVAGAAPSEPTAGRLTAAGATDLRTLTWGAPGSRVIIHSGCARSVVTDFLADPGSVGGSEACPS